MIVLASCSPRRRELLSSYGIDFILHDPCVQEQVTGLYPLFVPVDNAILKATRVSRKYPDDLVIAADTVIEFQNQIIGKPEHPSDAEDILMKLSGNFHHVSTVVCLTVSSSSVFCVFTETSKVEFLPFSRTTAQEYVSLVDTLDKAGAYGIQEHREMLVKQYEGEIENIIGLPKKKLLEALHACGFGNKIMNLAPSE